ncbi:uncharacterized protein GBIM_15258 [Gryllus bimaculatus]|nr:uncharacterized protein GBIM_15258 [Gryllus bimaculatus]
MKGVEVAKGTILLLVHRPELQHVAGTCWPSGCGRRVTHVTYTSACAITRPSCGLVGHFALAQFASSLIVICISLFNATKLKSTELTAWLFALKAICPCRSRIEVAKRTERAPFCKRCCCLSLPLVYCQISPRCIHFGEGHLTKDCSNNKPAVCCNCEANHSGCKLTQRKAYTALAIKSKDLSRSHKHHASNARGEGGDELSPLDLTPPRLTEEVSELKQQGNARTRPLPQGSVLTPLLFLVVRGDGAPLSLGRVSAERDGLSRAIYESPWLDAPLRMRRELMTTCACPQPAASQTSRERPSSRASPAFRVLTIPSYENSSSRLL